jgi:transposase-like protein
LVHERISRSQVNRLCEEIDERVKAFLDRPIEGDGTVRNSVCGWS